MTAALPFDAVDASLPDVERRYDWTVPHGRKECWKAETTDGVWVIERLELPGTPWETVHKPTGIETGMWARKLDDARRMIANGAALAAVEERAAAFLGGVVGLIL